MIYGNNVVASAPVRLYGKVADNFLESVGVSIFDDGDITIGESIYDLSTACDILEENGIILCEDCIVLEGKQAEEYKARKAKEREDIKKANLSSKRRSNSYSNVGIKKWESQKTDKPYNGTGDRKNYPFVSKEDDDRRVEVERIVDREEYRRRSNAENARNALDDHEDRGKYIKHPGKRPTGILKFGAKRAYDNKKKEYEIQKTEHEKHRSELLDNLNKANKNYSNMDRDSAYDALMRNKRRSAKKYGKKPTVQHNSTIFSDVEII